MLNIGIHLAGVNLVANFLTIIKIFVEDIILEKFFVSRCRFDKRDYGEDIKYVEYYLKKVDELIVRK